MSTSTDTAAPPGWARVCTSVQAQVEARTGRAVAVTALGVRDELTAPPSVPRGVPIQLTGRCAIVGGGCARCLARRWQSVRTRVVRDAVELGTELVAVGEPPFGNAFAIDALAALVQRSRPRDAVDVLDLRTLLVQRVPMLPDSTCPVCGPAPAREAVPVLADSPKLKPDVFRGKKVTDYRLPIRALVNEFCGTLGPKLITELGSSAVSRVGGFFTVRCGDHLADTQWSGHADSFHASEQIGVVEGLERIARTLPMAQAPVMASLAELGDTALDPRVCGTYPPECYAIDRHVVPFDEHAAIPWVPAYSLRDERRVLVPEILAYQHSHGAWPRFTQECSNGCASGGSLAEAVYYGLMELIERDSILLAWYSKADLPEIDPATSTRADVHHTLDRLAMYGYRTRFFDARMAFPVPAVIAVAERVEGGLGAFCFGSGANLAPEAAIASALSEVAALTPKLAESTQREQARLRAMVDDFGQVRELNDHWRLYGLPEMAQHLDFLLKPRSTTASVGALADGLDTSASSANLLDGLQWTVNQLAATGLDVLVIDQTLPEQRALGLHTAAVIVPGLMPIDFGWHRQRALTMPRMHAVAAAGLNLVPHPFP